MHRYCSSKPNWLLKQCSEEFIEILKEGLKAFSVEVTWPFLSWIKQTFLVPWACDGLIKRALTLWEESIKKIYRRGLWADLTKQKAVAVRGFGAVSLVILRAKKLEPGWVCFFLSSALHRSSPPLRGPAVSFQHVLSERAVGVSAILLAARCHPFQCCSIKTDRHFMTPLPKTS